jgi:hypothetical protein
MGYKKKTGYLGNPNLKEVGTQIEFTKEQVEEYIKCSNDPVYFIKKYIKIVTLDKGLEPFDLYDYQENIVNTIQNNRYVIAKLPRQTGKSTTTVAWMVHYLIFNQNVNIAILANKLKTAMEIMKRLKEAYEYLPKWLQHGVVEWNKTSIALENGSRIMASATSASAVRGGSYNVIFLDEFAHVPSNVADEFFSSVYPTITSGNTTKVIIVSTPNGLNMFYSLWQGANRISGEEGKNEYIPIEVHWSQVPLYPGGPLRDQKWKERTIKQLGGGSGGEQKFRSEYDCDFIGSSNTLISTSKLHVLSPKKPITVTKEGLWIYEEPKQNRSYVMTVDTSRGQGKDYSAAVVFDITEAPYKMVAKYRNNIISPMLFPTILAALGKKYGNAYILVEVNDIGGQVADILHYDLEYDNLLMSMNKGRSGMVLNGGFGRGETIMGVRTTATVKKLGCSILKSLIEQDKLIIEDEDTIKELLSFVAKWNSFAADDGHTDDLVMCLVIFAWLTKQGYFKEITNIDIRKELFEGEIKKIEEDDWLGFGFISTVDQDDLIIKPEESGGDNWSIVNG